MLCAIYRSPRHDQTYLYVQNRGDFSQVPEELLKHFGLPQFAMLLSLNRRDRLANANIAQVRLALQEQGFYLQVPPPIENPGKA